MKKLIAFTALALLVLIVGIASYSQTHQPPQGYTLIQNVTEDGRLVGRQIRKVKASGEFYVVEDHFDQNGQWQKRRLFAGDAKHGLVTIDEEHQKLLHPTHTTLQNPLAQGAQEAGYIAGYHVLCSTGLNGVKIYQAPDLNNEVLKTELPDKGLVFETVEVIHGEPSFTIPDYQVKQ